MTISGKVLDGSLVVTTVMLEAAQTMVRDLPRDLQTEITLASCAFIVATLEAQGFERERLFTLVDSARKIVDRAQTDPTP